MVGCDIPVSLYKFARKGKFKNLQTDRQTCAFLQILSHLNTYCFYLVHSCDDEVRFCVHDDVFHPGLVRGRTQRHRHVACHPRGPDPHHVAQSSGTEEADTCRGHVIADEVFDTLSQFPAPEVKVFVQVVSVCIRDSYLVSVRKYI